MRKKEILATLVMLTLMQGSAYAAEYNSKHFKIHEDVNWGEYALEVDGSVLVIPYGGDTVTIDDGVTLTMNFADGTSVSGSKGGLALSIDEMNDPDNPFGHEDRDLNMSGGKFIAIGEGKDKGGIGGWITDTATGRIMINNTDLDFIDFTYGFALKGSETHVINDITYLENKYGVYAYNTGKFFAESKDFSAVNGEVGLYSAGNGSIDINSDKILFQNNTCAVTTTGEGQVEITGQKLHMIDNNYGVSSTGKSVIVDVGEFLFGTSMTIDFPITAVYGAANTKIDVTAGKAELKGQVLAEGNAEVKFLKDDSTENKQMISVYSLFGDAVSAGSDDGKASIGFDANALINSQGDAIYHADKQGVRTIAAIRALRNSEITLDNAAGVYGDIISGRGIANSDATGGKITINSVDYADFKGDVLAGNDGVIDLTLNNELINFGKNYDLLINLYEQDEIIGTTTITNDQIVDNANVKFDFDITYSVDAIYGSDYFRLELIAITDTTQTDENVEIYNNFIVLDELKQPSMSAVKRANTTKDGDSYIYSIELDVGITDIDKVITNGVYTVKLFDHYDKEVAKIENLSVDELKTIKFATKVDVPDKYNVQVDLVPDKKYNIEISYETYTNNFNLRQEADNAGQPYENYIKKKNVFNIDVYTTGESGVSLGDVSITPTANTLVMSFFNSSNLDKVTYMDYTIIRSSDDKRLYTGGYEIGEGKEKNFIAIDDGVKGQYYNFIIDKEGLNFELNTGYIVTFRFYVTAEDGSYQPVTTSNNVVPVIRVE